ncbi:hypothetical protein GIB67_010048 [Kingdonia uniflora]|uniref:BED-type domain-containing protein n=1 Tax=Kingdonia uniflora TaxID=39325 RepID=A0A7J7KV51_9MAGN|nr:hypothetical protein GIB67_010048 [Kingdonia uniflora]
MVFFLFDRIYVMSNSTPSSPTPNDVIMPDDTNQKNKHERSLRSTVWLEFDRKRKPDGKVAVTCHHCKKILKAVGGNQTLYLRNHLKRCLFRKNKQSGQPQIVNKLNSNNNTSSIKIWKFSQARSSADLGRMIIKHEYPFKKVEHEYFKLFVNLNPQFKLISRNTLKSDCMERKIVQVLG